MEIIYKNISQKGLACTDRCCKDIEKDNTGDMLILASRS